MNEVIELRKEISDYCKSCYSPCCRFNSQFYETYTREETHFMFEKKLPLVSRIAQKVISEGSLLWLVLTDMDDFVENMGEKELITIDEDYFFPEHSLYHIHTDCPRFDGNLCTIYDDSRRPKNCQDYPIFADVDVGLKSSCEFIKNNWERIIDELTKKGIKTYVSFQGFPIDDKEQIRLAFEINE